MKRVVFAFLLCVVSIFAEGQNALGAETWNDRLAQKTLPEIARLIEHPDKLPWPKLTFDIDDKNAEKGYGKNATILPEMLFAKIRDYEANTKHEKSTLDQAIAVYGSLSRGLQACGGYANLCLADATNRLALARLAETLVNDRGSLNEVTAALAQMQCTQFSAAVFIEMIKSEPSQKANAVVLEKQMDGNEIRSQIFHMLGTTEGGVMAVFFQSKAGTTLLLRNLQIAVLLERMAMTDALAKVNIAGAIEFLKRGGSDADLQELDVRPYHKVMNGAEEQFRSDLLHINEVDPGHIEGLFREFKYGAPTSMFVVIALQ